MATLQSAKESIVNTPNPKPGMSIKKAWSLPRIEVLGNLHEVIRLGQGKSGANNDGMDGQGNMMN